MQRHQFLAACVMIERRPHTAARLKVKHYEYDISGTPYYEGGKFYIKKHDRMHGPYHLLNIGIVSPFELWSAISPVEHIVRRALNDSINGIGEPDEKITLGLLDLAYAAAKLGYQPMKREAGPYVPTSDSHCLINDEA